MDVKEKEKLEIVDEVVVKNSSDDKGKGNLEIVEEVVVKNGADDKENGKLELVEEVVVKDGITSVDTTDKRAQQYKQSNSFAAKKTVAQGMMDVALITANANQLRYLIEFQRNSPTFYVILSLIIISLILQIAVGVSLIFKGRFDIKGQSKSPNARKINNYVVVGVFLITIINVFIASFSITTPIATPLVTVPSP